MRHRHNGFSTYGLNVLRQGDEHLAYVPSGTCHFTFTFYPGCLGQGEAKANDHEVGVGRSFKKNSKLNKIKQRRT